MNIAVTGYKGFIGSNLVTFLKKKKHTVLTPSIDTRNYDEVDELVKQSELVFHLAADMGGVGYFSKHQYKPFVNNMQSDLNVIKACEKYGRRLLYPSSACAYPTYIMETGVPLQEEMLEKPASPDQMYGWEKLTVMKLSNYAPFDMRVCILHTIYGEGQEYEGIKAKFPPQLVYKALMAKKNNELLRIWGDGKQERTFLYISDAIEKLYEVAMDAKYYGPVNISSDSVVTIKQCADAVCDYIKLSKDYIYELDKPVGVTKRSADTNKFKRYYSYRDKVPLEDGFRRMVDYVKGMLQ